jgi:hypothetical protein
VLLIDIISRLFKQYYYVERSKSLKRYIYPWCYKLMLTQFPGVSVFTEYSGIWINACKSKPRRYQYCLVDDAEIQIFSGFRQFMYSWCSIFRLFEHQHIDKKKFKIFYVTKFSLIKKNEACTVFCWNLLWLSRE